METEELQWGTKTPVKILIWVAFAGLLIWFLVAGLVTELWPPLIFAGLAACVWSRGGGARLTEDELVLRYPVGTRHIPRTEVVSAQFIYNGLRIQLSDGSKAFAFLRPKWNSTELSSGAVPEPGSTAYRITEWAKQAPRR